MPGLQVVVSKPVWNAMKCRTSRYRPHLSILPGNMCTRSWLEQYIVVHVDGLCVVPQSAELLGMTVHCPLFILHHGAARVRLHT
jgi:hypothetical protein